MKTWYDMMRIPNGARTGEQIAVLEEVQWKHATPKASRPGIPLTEIVPHLWSMGMNPDQVHRTLFANEDLEALTSDLAFGGCNI